jgi:NAD(P) transhydrogenase subunit alpha
MIPAEVFLTFILMLSIFLGFELINKVPATLHTPLMSGANAISGITLVGAVGLVSSTGDPDLAKWLAVGAVALASINVVGGYLVTDRMLAMFKKKGG